VPRGGALAGLPYDARLSAARKCRRPAADADHRVAERSQHLMSGSGGHDFSDASDDLVTGR
jgi:hypothetical protein